MRNAVECAPVVCRAKNAPAELGPIYAIRIWQEDRRTEVGDDGLVRWPTAAGAAIARISSISNQQGSWESPGLDTLGSACRPDARLKDVARNNIGVDDRQAMRVGQQPRDSRLATSDSSSKADDCCQAATYAWREQGRQLGR